MTYSEDQIIDFRKSIGVSCYFDSLLQNNVRIVVTLQDSELFPSGDRLKDQICSDLKSVTAWPGDRQNRTEYPAGDEKKRGING